MSEQTDEQYYQETLEQSLHLLCEAMGEEVDFYDRDQADGECYMDCFRDAASLIKNTNPEGKSLISEPAWEGIITSQAEGEGLSKTIKVLAAYLNDISGCEEWDRDHRIEHHLERALVALSHQPEAEGAPISKTTTIKPLLEYLEQDHNCIFLESQINEIRHIVERIK